MTLRYTIPATVVDIALKKEALGAKRTGVDALTGKPEFVLEERDLGWFVTFAGSRESLFLDHVQPAIRVGQRAKIIIEFED